MTPESPSSLPPEIRCESPLASAFCSPVFQKFQRMYEKKGNILRHTLHEAGHCIAAWRCGFQVQAMDMRSSLRDGDDQPIYSASFSVKGSQFREDSERVFHSFAVISVAGLIAERLVFRDDLDIFNEVRWVSDIEQANFNLERLTEVYGNTEISFASILRESETILREEWMRVERVTMGALKPRTVMKNSRLMKLIEGDQ